MRTKRIINVKQQPNGSTPETNGPFVYLVKKLTNVTTPHIGKATTQRQVLELINRGITVNVA
ncbi:hypothetical protein LCGC14_0401850 [marine sediment metagenome]|uniref:Uncharacterized protein n=1 Tax=marine sediment metagenome TaxID=412755 RepID=A0A0F9TEW2_9ZZZZ